MTNFRKILIKIMARQRFGLEEEIIGSVNIEINAADGRLISRDLNVNSQSKNEIPLSIEGLLPGIYFLKAQTSGKVFAGKFVVD
jgi:hypothetical protein